MRLACGVPGLRPVTLRGGRNQCVRVCRSSARRSGPKRAGLLTRCVAEAPAEKAGRPGPKRAYKKTADEETMEKGMRELPRPADVQQTLVESFTLGGVGLHTGEYAYVRVRPAYAGEGRYFVHVPKGTNCDLFKLEDESTVVDEDDLPEVLSEQYDPETERMRVELFTQYLVAQEDEGFEGSFSAFLDSLDAAPLTPRERAALIEVTAAARADEGRAAEEEGEEAEEGEALGFADEDELVAEDIQAADPSKETTIPATIFSAVAAEGVPYVTLAAEGDGGEERQVLNPSLLLAALEACGVDNARIEIEGGNEVPVLDNSALGWTLCIQQAGVREAPIRGQPLPPISSPAAGGDGSDEEEEREQPTRLVLTPPEPVTVQRGDAFVSFFPGDWSKVTAGIDVQDAAAIIGQQWYSWRTSRDYHFRYELAPARGWVESVDRLFEMRAAGQIKCGSEGLFVIGHGERWWDPQLVRFHDDEPARHDLLQLLGALALLGTGGNSGVPLGHVVAFNADADLLVDFCRAMVDSLESAEEGVAVDSADLLEAQMALLEEEAADRDRLGKLRRQRAGELAAMGGPAAAGEWEEAEEGEEEGEEEAAR